MGRKWGVLGAVAGLIFAVNGWAATINVPSVGNSTIQSAIYAAVDGDTVLVADGTYAENISFVGKNITVKSQNGASTTIIDGNQNGSVVTFENSEKHSAVLDGFTITNGSGFKNNGSTRGGGIYCNSSSPTITNCNIVSNNAGAGGGIFCVDYQRTIITSCTIRHNTAGEGGAIEDRFGSLQIRNCSISSNTASGNGGGILIWGQTPYGKPTISNSSIIGNTSDAEGGGIYGGYCSFDAISCNISSNKAESGAGIYEHFEDDRKTGIIKCIIRNNTASQNGGGIADDMGWLTIVNTIIADNKAGNGGGLYKYYSAESHVVNCTLANNIATNFGGAAYCISYRHPKTVLLNIVNSILWGNTAKLGGKEIYPQNSFDKIVYSDVQQSKNGKGNIKANPRFVGNGDYHLTASSPCIGRGTSNKTLYPNLPDDDIDGDTRGSKYDIGADQY